MVTEVAEGPCGKVQPEPSTQHLLLPELWLWPPLGPREGGAATDCPQLPQELELQEQLAGWPRGEGGESQSSCQSRVTAVGRERVTAGARASCCPRCSPVWPGPLWGLCEWLHHSGDRAGRTGDCSQGVHLLTWFHSPPDTWPAGPEGALRLLRGQRSGLTSWGCGPVRTAHRQTRRDPGPAGH